MHRHFTPQRKLVGGNILDSFQKLNQLIEKNDGVRNFSVLTNNCFDSDAPFTEDRETHVRITNNLHDINQLSHSFLRMEFDADVSLSKEITGSYTLTYDKSKLIKVKDTHVEIIKPKEYSFDELFFMMIPNDRNPGDYFLISDDPDAQPVKLEDYQQLLGTNTSILLIKYVRYNDELDREVWQVAQFHHFCCEYNYSESLETIVNLFKNNDENIFLDEIENICTQPYALAKITVLQNINDGDVKDYQGNLINDILDTCYIDYDVAPIWFGTNSEKYLCLVHKYNNPWNDYYKTQLDSKSGFGAIPIFEIDIEYWNALYDNSDIIFAEDSIFLNAELPTYYPNIKIKSYDNQRSFYSRLDEEIEPDIYWVNYNNENILIPITSDDGTIDPTVGTPKDVIKVLFDRWLREGYDGDFVWLYEPMTLSAFRYSTIGDMPIVRLFLGWKNANEALKQLQIENSNVDTKYFQKECSKEGFCYSTFMPNEGKKNNLFAHTSYDHANTGFRGICGGYIDIDPLDINMDLVQEPPSYDKPYKLKREFTMRNLEVILPIPEILCFRHFEDFPGALGDIVMKFYLNKDSMVYCQCNPKICYEQNYLLRNEYFEECPKELGNYCSYTHAFTQIGQPAKLITNYVDLTSEDVTLNVKQLYCKKLTCECYGYNITQECKKQIVQLFSPNNPFIIPANQVDVINFIRPMGDSNGLYKHYSSDLTWALRNVSKLIIVFPQNSSDITTFRNPMLEQVQLRIQGRKYPQTPFLTTYGPRFLSHMLRGNDIGSFYEADEEYFNSIMTPVFKYEKNSVTDITSFIMTSRLNVVVITFSMTASKQVTKTSIFNSNLTLRIILRQNMLFILRNYGCYAKHIGPPI